MKHNTIANTIPRQDFLIQLGMVSISMMLTKSKVFGFPVSSTNPLFDFKPSLNDEDIFTYISRVSGGFDLKLYKKLVGAANEFKEGDEIAGIAAADETARKMARNLIANTLLSDVIEQPLFRDEQYDLIHNTTAFEKDIISICNKPGLYYNTALFRCQFISSGVDWLFYILLLHVY